ncbi:GHKL domain-containing protein [candidate division KSB1 bacterium]|nr:GHKL domain-containing protein [candidate division KSB1 bacterium]
MAYSTGFACGDPDNDGDIDCYLCNNDQWSEFLRNSLNNRNFLKIKLIGTKSNRDAVGAKTFLYEAGHINEKGYCLGLREVNGGYGYGCQNSLVAHYGVDAKKEYDLKVYFPSGIKIIRRNIKPGQTLIFEEQQGLAKFNSRATKYILRTIKKRKNQFETILLVTYFALLFIGATLMKIKKWISPHFVKYLVGIPIIFYILITAFLYDQEFILDELLPFSTLLLSFLVTFFTLKKRTSYTIQERIAEELLTITKAFDHGSWATSYLNQFQLFATNLPNKKSVSAKVEHQLTETISGFYDQVYEAIKKISQLALEASIETNHATELQRQLLFLSDNLNKIKVNLNIKKDIPVDVWNHIFRVVDDIKINIKAIKFSVFKYFTCDVYPILLRSVSQFQEKVNYPVKLTSGTEKKILVCLKPSDLAVILDNLLSNANRAMLRSVDKRIEIKTRSTDQYFEIECSDTGTGIPKNLWEKIFDLNYSTKSGKTKGGFGLYYSRSVLEKFGGSIEVIKSGKNKGTKFRIRLRLL